MARRRKKSSRAARRLARLLLWLAIGAAFVLLLRSPLRRIGTMVRLWTEPLRAPLLVPVAGVPRAHLADTWGAARSGGRRHEGIDIFGPCGQPVLSATEGIVLSLGNNRLGGRVVRVFGPGGSWHYYAHLSGYAAVSRGDHVQPGDTLGFVGNTGDARTTPCHLHYGIYRAGGAVNPYPYLAPRTEGHDY